MNLRAEKLYSLFIWHESDYHCKPVLLFSLQPEENVYDLERIQGTVVTDTKGQVNIPWRERERERECKSSVCLAHGGTDRRMPLVVVHS